jgi:ABC-2 type transport system permease protein
MQTLFDLVRRFKSLRSSAFLQFFLVGLRSVLRERSVLFWSFLFPLLVTGVFVQAFSNEGRPSPFRVGVVAPLPKWTSVLGLQEGVTLIEIENLESRENFKKGEEGLAKAFHKHQLDALFKNETLYTNQQGSSAKAQEIRLLAAKAQTNGERVQLEFVDVAGVRFVDWFAPGMIGLTLLTGGLFGTGFRITSDRELGCSNVFSSPLFANPIMWEGSFFHVWFLCWVNPLYCLLFFI